jgi:hypothetical protein
MQEFLMRGKRDPEVRKVVEQMHFHWRKGIERIVIDGVGDGTFRTDIDPKVMLSMLMSIFSGIETVGVDKINEIERCTESWILSDKVKKQVKKKEP